MSTDTLEQKKNSDVTADISISPIFAFAEPVEASVVGLPDGFTVTTEAWTLHLRAGQVAEGS